MFNKRVYYISGFDPRGSRFYHRLFKDESKKSEALSGAVISTGKRRVIDEVITQWQVDSTWAEDSYKIDYRFMAWDDVMKCYWQSNIWQLILKTIPMYANHLKIRLFPKFKAVAKGPYICIIYPLLFCSISLIATLVIGVLVYMLAFYLSKLMLLALSLSGIAMFISVKCAIYLGEKLNVWWILQTYHFLASWMQKPQPELELKLQTFAERIIQDQADSPVDEVILVGHCLGSPLAVQVMANVLGLQHEGLKNKLSVLTLGQCIPYLSYAPSANHFREKLAIFAHNQHYPWFNMGAKADPLCFQEVNPAAAEGVNLTNENVPHQFVVKPYNMFSPTNYKAIKKDKMRIHFQYLMAADIKTDFDYFEIITGAPAQLEKYNTR